MEKAGSANLFAELGSTLERARELISNLSHAEGPATADTVLAQRVHELEAQLVAAERDREELTARMVEAEHQLGRLMNLYVATFQLHATLDPIEVQATIAEIAVDLLGAERFVLLLRVEETSECEVALARGLEDDNTGLYAHQRYRGGDPLVDAALEDGVLRLGPDEFSEAIAAVPLRVQEAIVGVLVVLKLFDHKAILRAEDRDLLDLLAAHAASALFAARVYSNTDRKLRTLESLVQLVRGT
ncbi:MAG: GAF domain-containing protein [Thermoanaerobaculia bacterium]|nr:GAF domain-containing protein [Thermoanaerobaculia bacterium]